MSLEQEIKDRVLEVGFDAVGITDATPIDRADVEHLEDWLQAGHAGTMRYMHRNLEKRIHPAALLEGAQSVIVVALNYKLPEQDACLPTADVPSGTVAQYARYDDYHDFMKPLLYDLADFIRSKTDETQRFKVCVDSVPLAERALATRAGLGFIGKNHMLIHPRLGPQVLLAELVTTVKLEPDPPTIGTCVTCDRCIRACPTGALQANGRFDARKCVSYLTIEHKGKIASELAEKMGARVFGCDECVLACPYHHAAPACGNSQFTLHSSRAQLSLSHILALTPTSFATEFAASPIDRPGLDGLKRNAGICMRNIQGR